MSLKEFSAVQRRFHMPQLGREISPPASGNLVPLTVTAMVVVTVAVGLIAKANGVYWGAPAQPLLLFYYPVFTPWLLISVAGLTGCLYFAVRLLRSDSGPARFSTGVFALALISRLVLNVARNGPQELYSVFTVAPFNEGRLEYLAAAPELKRGIGHLLDNFDSLVATLPVHPAGHPPGMLVLIDFLGIGSPKTLAALTIVAGAAATPVLYALGRQLFDERTARVAALLFIFVPTALLYGATSADALFATLALIAVVCLLSKRPQVVILGAFALAVATFFSYALLAVAGWAGLVRWRRDGFVSMAKLALLCGGVLIAFYAVLAVATGFDVIGSIQATHDRYFKGVAHVRPYLFYFFGSPAAFLLMLGPVAWLASRSLASREITAVALAAVILLAVVVGYTKAETERIWLYLVPLACLSAARALPERWIAPTLVALATQAVLIEVAFNTYW